MDGKVLLTFNARNEHDRCKFAEDLRESISEMDEMESLRIETELERQKSARTRNSNPENRDSGVADVEVCAGTYQASPVESHHGDAQLKRSALSNSLLDIHEQCKEFLFLFCRIFPDFKLFDFFQLAVKNPNVVEVWAP